VQGNGSTIVFFPEGALIEETGLGARLDTYISGSSWFTDPQSGKGEAMSTGLIIAIVVVVLILLVLAAIAARKAKARRELERRRLSEQAGGHRQEADLHASKAQEREQEAREAAERAERERELADRHGSKADDLEQKL
jgi:flagellar biosynthesis/type III secretory pathway M-ring protein FliF/YscJ